MEFFQQTYTALRGPTGVQQTPADTITRLSDRLSPSTLLADRRAAVLSLKGLARVHKQLVGTHALQGLLGIIQNDADTVTTLCDTFDGSYAQRDLGLDHTDRVLEDEKTAHKLFALLGDQDPSLRYSACILLIGILQNRPLKVQAYFLKAPVGPATVIALLDGEKEIVGHAIAMLAALIRQSVEIQKILAFDGIFEKLLSVVTREGGLEGQSVVTDALKCVDTLLRFNTSNQSYFRETNLPSLLCSLLFFNPNVQPDQAVPQDFALQFWTEDKIANVGLILESIGLLLGSKGSGLREGYAFTKLLIEMGLASNAPTPLKVKCLRLLPPAAAPLLPDMILTPYMPVPDTNGEEWDRLEAATGIDALLELIMHGEYNGQDSVRRQKESVDLRATAVGVFEHFLRDDLVKEAIVSGMLPSENSGTSAHSPVTPLLFGLIIPPSSPFDRASVSSVQFAAILFAHLLRHAPRCKDLARKIVPPPLTPLSTSTAGGAFFVPADGDPPPPPESTSRDDTEDGPQSLLALITEHLSLAFLQRSRAGLAPREAREADRVICVYLLLLSQWLWEDPRAVREFIEAGGLGVLVEQLNQPSEIDVVVPGLCAFLLGVCYEFNREPGEITRVTMYSILTRLGADVLVGRMNRMREDERIKVVGPDSWVLPCPTPGPQALDPAFTPMYEGEMEIWFDWAFVDFWKANIHTIQRGIVADPDSASSSTAQSGEESILVASLRGIIAKQAAEIEALQIKLKELTTTPLAFAGASTSETSQTTAEIDEERVALKVALEAERTKRAEVEKEQEDLLVLLDELSSKRAKDKQRMEEQGMDVSEDEEGEGEDEDKEEEE
ncbi:p115 like vesicle tethering protein [Russula earlei]|uniref:P115 like vesicle tethering protein n=1 Tax=Russula earlei TaxID=71964 RepID=A0ACC0TVI9_9AGAM|nr:p115 like vesicle tethering protein [Russula earlei]